MDSNSQLFDSLSDNQSNIHQRVSSYSVRSYDDLLKSLSVLISLLEENVTWHVTTLALTLTLVVMTTVVIISKKTWTSTRGKDKQASTSKPTSTDRQTTTTTPTTTTTTSRPIIENTPSEISPETITPTSVNYHFNRKCNYQCGFCFHTAKTSYYLPLEEAKKGLKMLQDAGMQKINFSGGEPFIVDRGRYVGELVRYCKQELKMSGVTIVSNGSLIREKWFREYGADLDILSVSCDSFEPETNAKTGRQQGLRDHIQGLRRVRDWCTEYKVAFKINTVVNTYNKDEDMTQNIMMLNPIRWKAYQCLVIDGENAGPEALRNAEKFVITDEEFQQFLDTHKDVPFLVPEPNETMRYSYIILDEYMRFLDGGEKKPSPSILDVGVEAAINRSKFDEQMYLKRGGKYVWSKADMKLDW